MNTQKEEVRGTRYVQSFHAFSRHITLPALHMLTDWGVLQTLYYWGFMGTWLHRLDQLLTPFPAPLPSLENGGWGTAESSKLLIMPWSFLWPAPNLGANRGLPHWNKRHSYHPVNPKGCRSLCFPARNQNQRPNIRTKDVPRYSSLRKLQGF